MQGTSFNWWRHPRTDIASALDPMPLEPGRSNYRELGFAGNSPDAGRHPSNAVSSNCPSERASARLAGLFASRRPGSRPRARSCASGLSTTIGGRNLQLEIVPATAPNGSLGSKWRSAEKRHHWGSKPPIGDRGSEPSEWKPWLQLEIVGKTDAVRPEPFSWRSWRRRSMASA